MITLGFLLQTACHRARLDSWIVPRLVVRRASFLAYVLQGASES